MRRIVLALVLVLAGCTATQQLTVKQQAVGSLQNSELALEAAHDLERSLCFNAPATESGGRCTNPLAKTVGLTDARHQQSAGLFALAFDVEIKAATALKTWKAGDPAPLTLVGYQQTIGDLLTITKTLDPGASAFLAKVQAAVDEAGKIAVLVGVK